MTLKYKTRGFVFKKNDRNESDRVFSVFTEDFGRLDIFAKAIRKINSKLRKDFDIFYFSDIEFIQGKSQKTLTDAAKIEKFDSIKKNSENFKVACQIADMLDGFIKGQEKDGKTFNLLEDFFDKFNNSQIKNHQLSFQYFFWNFISLQGYHLQVEKCAVCQDKLNPYNIYFSTKDGGIVCEKCSALDKNAKKINSDIVKILRLILKKDWQTISKLKIDNASQKMLEDISQNAIQTFCPMHC